MIRAADGSDPPIRQRALAWARELHAGQRYGGRPYAVAPHAAPRCCGDFGYGGDPVLMSAAYLHDAIEDTA